MKRVNVEQNIFELKVVPNAPKVNRNEQVAMYVPIASNDTPGVASFDQRYFNVDPLTGNVKIKNGPLYFYKIEVASNSAKWKNVDDTWQLEILKSSHKFEGIQNIIVERKMPDGTYKNILYSYEIRDSYDIFIIVDYKIDIKITLIGNEE